MDFILHPDIIQNYILSDNTQTLSYSKPSAFIFGFFLKCLSAKSETTSHIASFRIIYSLAFNDLINSSISDENHKLFYQEFVVHCHQMGLMYPVSANGNNTKSVLDGLCDSYQGYFGVLLLLNNNYEHARFKKHRTLIISSVSNDEINTSFILSKLILDGIYIIRSNNFPIDCKGERYPTKELELEALFSWLFNLAFLPDSICFCDDYFKNIPGCSFLKVCKIFNKKQIFFYRNSTAKSLDKKELPLDMENIKTEMRKLLGGNITFHKYHQESYSHIRKIYFNNLIITYTDDLGNLSSRRGWDIIIKYDPVETSEFKKLLLNTVVV